jgi:class 3 adenylate cyclase/predicted ATPase
VDIAGWLRELGLERYEEAFRENEIDGEILPKLTADDLKDIGVTTVGHRRKLLEAIAALTEPAAAARTESSIPDGAAPRARAAQAERRQLTVLVVDLVGSTELAARLDPEDMGRVIRGYQECCARAVERWGGHIAKYMGDGVLAYFGWPQAHEDAAERAVRAGLELAEAVRAVDAPGSASGGCEAVGRLGEPEAKPDVPLASVVERRVTLRSTRPTSADLEAGIPLAARIGIATGLVMVGELIGEGAASEHTVVGETPNLAARLQALAEPGSVVISQATRRLVGGLFLLEDLGPLRLKGFAEPLAVWRVEGEGRAEGRFEARQTAGLTPLVGREEELNLLLARWRRAVAGEGQVALLSGEPGIGKSRIVQALRERLAGQSYTCLSHYCSPYHSASALYPIVGLLERAAGFTRDDLPEAKLGKLEALLARGTEGLAEAVPLIADVLGIAVGERYPSPNLSPQRKAQRTLEVLVEQVDGLAARQPVLAVYEDVHWIDPTTLAALGLLIERVQRLSVLLLITFRPEFAPPWSSHAHVTQLSLARLTRRHGSAIVARMAGSKALPEQVLNEIVARTDGIPLFVEELTKTVLESGLLQDAGDHFELAGPLPSLAIPSTLQDSLMARLDRLAPVKEVAQTAAAIGREFDHGLLAAVSPLSAPDLESALDQLVQSELIFRRGAPPDATYTFKHALVQEAAYSSLLKSRRQQLHARIAQALEEQFPEVAAHRPEVLARHLTDAALTEKAVNSWHRAAQQAGERFAHKEAIAHLTRSLELLESLPETVDSAREEARLQIALGISLTATRGPASEMLNAYLRAQELAERIGDTRLIYAAVWGHWYFNLLRMRFDTARELSYKLLELASREQDKELLLQAHHAAWPILLCRGEILLCREHCEQGLALYDRDEHRAHALRYGGHDPGACAQYHAAPALWLLGYPDQAVAISSDAVRLASELAQPFSLALALAHASFLHQFRGEAHLAQERAEATATLSVEQGFPHYRATGTLMRGWAAAVRGDFEAGTAALQEGLAALRAAGANVRRSYYLALLADVCGRAGRPEAGQNAIAEALAFAEESGERWWEAELHRLSGELLLVQSGENRAQAEGCFLRASEIARQQSAKAFELRAATSLGRLWAQQGKPAQAHDLLAPVYGWFTEGFETQDLKHARALLDELR